MDTTYEDSFKHIAQNRGTEAETVKFAGFWIRFWAYLLDLIVIGSINRIVIHPFLIGFDIPSDQPSFLPLETVLTGATFYLYFFLMTKYFRQTLGKMVFGIEVIAKDGTLTWGALFFREIVGRSISKALFGLVYIWVAFSPKKRGVHDYFADTLVVYTKE